MMQHAASAVSRGQTISRIVLDLDAKAVCDLSPGCGTCARACIDGDLLHGHHTSCRTLFPASKLNVLDLHEADAVEDHAPEEDTDAA